MRILLALMTSMLFFTACEFQQNPVQGASDAVQNGQAPGEKIDPVQAIPKGVMSIDGPPLVQGRIGSEMQLKLTGRAAILEKPVEFEVFVENLADFPGATFDSETGIFRWIPTKEKVFGQPSASFVVRAVIVSKKTDVYPTSMSERASFPIVVINDPYKPIVKSATAKSSYTTEEVEIPVLIEDLDAMATTDVMLSFHECLVPGTGGEKSISHLARVKSMVIEDAPGAFTANIALALDKAGRYPSGKYCFVIMATSKFKMTSDPYRIVFELVPAPQSTSSTWNFQRVLKRGETKEFGFSIYDSTRNGELSLDTASTIEKDLPGSSITCKQAYNKWQLDCNAILVTTPATATIGYSTSIRVKNSIPVINKSVLTTHSLSILVEAVTP